MRILNLTVFVYGKLQKKNEISLKTCKKNSKTSQNFILWAKNIFPILQEVIESFLVHKFLLWLTSLFNINKMYTQKLCWLELVEMFLYRKILKFIIHKREQQEIAEGKTLWKSANYYAPGSLFRNWWYHEICYEKIHVI